DVQDPAVRRGQQPRLKRPPALAQGALEVQGSEYAVLGGAERQVHEGGQGFGGAAFPRGGAVRALGPGAGGVAVEWASLDQRQRREQRPQGPGGGALGGALLAAHQHAADGRVDRVQQEGCLQRLLPDQGTKWVI